MLVTEKSMISALATFLKHEIPFQVPCHAIDEEFYVFTTSFCIPFTKHYRFFLTIDRLRHFFRSRRARFCQFCQSYAPI